MAIEVFGSRFQSTRGWIAVSGRGEYRHRFGGTGWSARAQGFPVPPSAILDLDLADPRLHKLSTSGLPRFPIMSFLNCEAWGQRQAYRIHPFNSVVEFIAPANRDFEALDPLDRLPDPLPEIDLELRAMQPDEIPATELQYWNACDSFVGGDSFLRILGPPLWLQEPIEDVCACGRLTHYIAGVGYESVGNEPSQTLMGSIPFFFGEAALYFFLCPRCLIVSVQAQPT